MLASILFAGDVPVGLWSLYRRQQLPVLDDPQYLVGVWDTGISLACGALYMDSGWAWMGIDATLPAYRGRGAQTALIHRRITDGVAAGVKGFTAETGQPSPSESSHSYQNYQRANFRKAYVSPNYRRT
jgi:hypothetical protein